MINSAAEARDVVNHKIEIGGYHYYDKFLKKIHKAAMKRRMHLVFTLNRLRCKKKIEYALNMLVDQGFHTHLWINNCGDYVVELGWRKND
jgi:hypothetical protein